MMDKLVKIVTFILAAITAGILYYIANNNNWVFLNIGKFFIATVAITAISWIVVEAICVICRKLKSF